MASLDLLRCPCCSLGYGSSCFWFSLTSGTLFHFLHWQASSVSMFSWTLIWYLFLWHGHGGSWQTQFERTLPIQNLFLPLLLSAYFLFNNEDIHGVLGMLSYRTKGESNIERKSNAESKSFWAAIPALPEQCWLNPDRHSPALLQITEWFCLLLQRCRPTMGFLTYEFINDSVRLES